MSERSLNLSLFDVPAPTSMPRVRDMKVSSVGTKEVTEFCRRYHYTGTGGNMAWRFGLWYESILLGVVGYNLPTREACESVFGSEHYARVWHMGRLSVAEDAPHNSESRLIGRSLRAIQAGRPDIWAVLTYAATDVGHIGYVYQATNAIYTGTGGKSFYYTDGKGVQRSTYLDGKWVSASRAVELGWVRHEGSPKHRYVYILGNKRERRDRLKLLRLPRLPYPKGVS